MRHSLQLLLLPGLCAAILSCRPISRSGQYGEYQLYQLHSLNSRDNEYGAILSPDGLRLYFVSDRPGGMGGYDLWYATRRTPTDTVFSKPVNMGPSINTEFDEGSLTIAADGMTIFFTASGRPDCVGRYDLYTARLNGEEVIEVRNLSEINSKGWEADPSITGDGRTLYFSATLGESSDAQDIFSSRLESDGRWSTPVNLGAPVNSDAQESSPFISRDGNTLYFVSRRVGGYGEGDFYVTRRLPGGWSTPEHLGVPFNTTSNEYDITSVGMTTVFTSTSLSGSNFNLFMVMREGGGSQNAGSGGADSPR